MEKSLEDKSYTIFIAIIVIFLLLTSFFTHSKLQDSSLCLLSSLAQSQAAVFAIVIGLNSIALQQTAANYSSRVTKVFIKDSKFLWGLFGFSIFYDIILINILPSSLEEIHYIPILLAIACAIFAYNYMIEYIQEKISIFLDPTELINKLKEDNNIRYVEDDRKVIDVEIFDFIIGSLNRHDYNSCEKGLSIYYQSELSEYYADGHIYNETLDEKFNDIISKFIRVGTITGSTKNDEATLYVIENIEKIFLHFNDKDKIRHYFLNSLDQISEYIEYCARNELEKSTISGMELLCNNFHRIEYDVIAQKNILRALANIGKTSSEMKLEKSTMEAINYIDSVIDLTIKNNNEIPRKLLTRIGFIGLNSAENKLENSCEKTVTLLCKVLIKTINQKEDNITSSTTDIIGKIGIVCITNGFEDCIRIIFESYNTLEKIVTESKDELKLNRKEITQKIEKWEYFMKVRKEKLYEF